MKLSKYFPPESTLTLTEMQQEALEQARLAQDVQSHKFEIDECLFGKFINVIFEQPLPIETVTAFPYNPVTEWSWVCPYCYGDNVRTIECNILEQNTIVECEKCEAKVKISPYQV